MEKLKNPDLSTEEMMRILKIKQKLNERKVALAQEKGLRNTFN